MNKTNQELYYERTPVLETERLILRPLTPEDTEAAFVWLSDERVNKLCRIIYTKTLMEFCIG